MDTNQHGFHPAMEGGGMIVFAIAAQCFIGAHSFAFVV
jgi:hypothetical protein